MKKTAARILTLALAVIMLAGLMITASAAAEPIAYDGDSVSFIKADGSAFGMLAPQDGTTAGISGDRVYIHLIPKNTTVYTSLHFGAIDDPDLTGGVPLNAEGTGYDLDFPIDLCGKAIPVAPVKADGGTTKDQYYLAIPAKDKLDVLPIPPAPEAPAYDGDAVNFVKEDGSSFGMFEAQEGTTAALDGDNVVIHYVPKNKTVYNAIHFGPITDAELTKDVSFNEDGTFDITLSKDKCGTLIAVSPIKVKDGATTSDQYYLAVPAADKLAAAAPAPAAEKTELTITNNTGMFKAVSAYLEVKDLEAELVVALSGTTYSYLFKGTYEQAAANGNNRDNWIQGAENADGKIEFRIPVADGESFIPCVSISNTYLTKFENGENSIERAFYPRQFVVDPVAKTLTVGDYEFGTDLTVTNNVKMFKVEAAALETIGGPNSNNYASTLNLTMGSDAFDKAFVGGSADVSEDAAVAIGEGRVFKLPVKWLETFGHPETLKNILGSSFVVSFHSVSKDTWYERQFTVDEAAGTLVIDEVAAPVEQPPVEQPPVEQPPVEQPAADATTYTVKSGDCLWNIAYKLYGTGRRFGDIAAANGIKAPYVIFAGQVLEIPAK